MRKNRIETELIEGLSEILDHKKGKRKLNGRTRELPEPAPAYSVREIKRLRTDLYQMSQMEFAVLLNIKVATVRAWEQGHNIPSGAAARLLQIFEKDRSIFKDLRPTR